MTDLRWWWKTLWSGKPHFIIGGEDRPYLLRWYLLPRNHRVNLYLHKFLRDDDDRALHDHPWWFVSVMLKGGYSEMTPKGLVGRDTGSVCFRPALHRHRVILDRDKAGRIKPCWTLVLTGPKMRTWGFWCPKGFVPWYDFVDRGDSGQVGQGCGE